MDTAAVSNSNYPTIKATHLFTDKRTGAETPVMRCFKWEDGSIHETSDAKTGGRCFPQFFTDGWLPCFPGPGKKMVPVPVGAADKVESGNTSTVDGGLDAILTTDERPAVYLHADAIMTLFVAACKPDWNNSIGYAESGNGDSATLVHHNRVENYKVVRVCEIDKKTRQSRIHNILLRERYAFELF